MTDKFSIIPFRQLTQIVFNQVDNGLLFGIPKDFFFTPNKNDPFRTNRYGQLMETPIGVAAGPHTQLAQNIIISWLCGARFIELKTIQTLDELEVSKPCIDMQDEGYNCEWSQELKIHESFDQYLNAWILIHVLKDKLNMGDPGQPGVIFNMSVGYNLEGILKENIQWFFNKMANASQEINEKIEAIKDLYPNITKLNINPCVSNNITLSTMHGCPPEEIETIGKHLMENKKLHTTIKLNPTLLGKDKINEIIKNSGFETEVPNIAFEHDPKYEDALKIINNLSAIASENNVHFGIKLTNTLESNNHKDIFPKEEEMMYMSGKALHPIAVNLASKLQQDYEGTLDISFSAGVNSENIHHVISCGLYPATVCSDILKPGGYGLLFQYRNKLRLSFTELDTTSINDFIVKSTGLVGCSHDAAIVFNLNKYSADVLKDTNYKQTGLRKKSIKTSRKLTPFDCVAAPCVGTCPTNQDIPDYMYYTSTGEFDKAFEVIINKNPFPQVTGMICDHLCQTKCTRINYDSPVLIREIKRFISEKAAKDFKPQKNHNPKNAKVGIIGAGPSGLSCAYYLASAGFEVDIYETKAKSGGMVSGAIPSFRLTHEAYNIDLDRIQQMGVKIHYNSNINKNSFEQINENSAYIFIATGAQSSKPLEIEGIDASVILDPLQFLFNVKNDIKTSLGKNVAIIGGGNTAMDTARTAFRLVGSAGKVTIIYRRMIKQMPADLGEVKAVMEEGIEIMELTAPVKISHQKGKIATLTCRKMVLGEKDDSGRRSPVEIPDSDFDIEFDTIIPAIGQDLAIDFIDQSLLQSNPETYETLTPNIFIGGDALRGASTAINAIGDGRKAAEKIIAKAAINFQMQLPKERIEKDLKWHRHQRNLKINPVEVIETDVHQRRNFDLVTVALTEKEAMAEAARCLLCDEVCNICTTVCPNLALHAFEINPKSYNLPVIEFSQGKHTFIDNQNFKVSQKHQILHIADWCNECGNCTTFCPTADAPYKVKPHLYVDKQSFENDDDVYYLDTNTKFQTLHFHNKGHHHSLTDELENYKYTFEKTEVILNKNTFEIIKIKTDNKNKFKLSLDQAAKMKVIMYGAESFFRG